ncbi:hypothetical protein Pcar_3334 [Syntrophotalea carbinolica DSM 2380]|uniref:Uncharacterized protein n=1 Tax=Syntrophotalea carbinolica (strain DSM 2380 / NBRC 103641 / GraBd1) TaxID=338963 RepID=Q0C6I8_SYNC1|nr:hypothetical protein Pcar_3334 [Syntrophotalea carbinolica DSM 2380]
MYAAHDSRFFCQSGKKGGGQVESDLSDLMLHPHDEVPEIVRKSFTTTTAPGSW